MIATGCRNSQPDWSGAYTFPIPDGTRYSLRQQPLVTLAEMLRGPLSELVLDRSWFEPENTISTWTSPLVAPPPPRRMTAMVLLICSPRYSGSLGLSLEQEEESRWRCWQVAPRQEKIPKEN